MGHLFFHLPASSFLFAVDVTDSWNDLPLLRPFYGPLPMTTLTINHWMYGGF